MSLSSELARPLLSREVARIVAGVFGSLIETTPVDELADARDHFVEHRDEYVASWSEMAERIELAERVEQMRERGDS